MTPLRLSPPQQWLAVFTSLFAGGALVGWATRVGVGTGIFLAGIVPMMWSLTYIRLGGPKARVGRTIDGKPLWGFDSDARKAELKRGVAIFGIGAALWAALAAGYLSGVIV